MVDKGENDTQSHSNTPDQVADYFREGSLAYHLIRLAKISLLFLTPLFGLWALDGFPDAHWTIPYLFLHSVVITVAVTVASISYSKKGKTATPTLGSGCDSCGAEIDGEYGNDWVLNCTECGKEWVYAGNAEYHSVDEVE